MALVRERPLPVFEPAAGDTSRPTERRARGPALWLLVVAGAYVLAMLVLVAPRAALGWDESLYVSQVDPRTPAGFFSAPRARGVTYLLAPLVQFTDSTVAIRVYLALLAGLLLVVGFWPWLRVFRRSAAVPLAALAFCSLWVVQFYGPSAMPDTWVAFGALAAVGWFVRYGYGASRWSLLGVGAGLAFVVLVRPSDAFWISVPLGVAMLVSRRWRRLPLYGTALAGGLIGLAPWLVESYQRFGGPVARLHRASQIEGGLGWHPTGIADQLSSLDGPLLCRPCSAHLANPLLAAWWLAIPLLVVLGLLAAAYARRVPAALVAAACGASAAVPYLFTIGYAAPRFLIPAYALAALPVGVLIAWLVTNAKGRVRVPAAVVVGIVLALQVASQAAVLVRQVDIHTASALGYQPAGAALKRYGLHAPCVVSGTDGVPVGYAAGCRAVEVSGPNTNITKAGLVATAHHEQAVYISHKSKPPAYLAGWRRLPLPTPRGEHHWFGYVPPWQ